MALAIVSVGLSNYGYALLLTHLLDVTAYSAFAASQSLILWALNSATASVPLILAQAIVRSTTEDERNSALRFVKLASVGIGLVAAAIVGAIVTRFGSPATALIVALSIFVLFLGTTTTGWLQGLQRIRSLSILYIAENVLKNGTGILLVTVAGLGATGALGAFGIGALAMLLRWPRTPRATARMWWSALANRDLWRRAAAMGGAQGLVSVFAAIDVVLVAILPGDRTLAASYQVSATVSRIPLYIASSVGVAFFPVLARRAADRTLIAAQSLRMYAAAALPVAAVLATAPPSVLALVFPSQYGAVATLLKFTTVTGLAVGGITMVTAFFQAADEYSCQWWLGAGLAAFVAGLLAGWRIDGITGLAAGGALGAMTAAAVMGYLLLRRYGHRAIARIPLLESLAAAAVLVALRPLPRLWLAVACAVGLHATMRFLRPGARHRREPRLAMPSRASTKCDISLNADKSPRGKHRTVRRMGVTR